MNPIVAAIAAYLAANTTLNTPEVNRHANRIEQVISHAPAGQEEQEISDYLMAQHLVPDQATADRQGVAIWRAVQSARVNQGNGGNNGGTGGGNTTTQTTTSSRSGFLAILTLIAAILAGVFGGVAAFRNNGAADIASVKGAVIDPDSGTSVLQQLNAHHEWAKANLAKTSDLAGIAKSSDLAGLAKETSIQAIGGKLDVVDGKVTHIEKVVVGALTTVDKKKPCKDGEAPAEIILSIKDLAHRSDLAGLVRKSDLVDLATADQFDNLAKRGELESAFQKQGTIAVVTEGEATLLTGDDALRAPPPPSPASVTPPAPASTPASAAL